MGDGPSFLCCLYILAFFGSRIQNRIGCLGETFGEMDIYQECEPVKRRGGDTWGTWLMCISELETTTMDVAFEALVTGGRLHDLERRKNKHDMCQRLSDERFGKLPDVVVIPAI